MKTTIETLQKYAKNPAFLHGGFNGKDANRIPVVYTYTANQFDETEAHEILGLRHTGWFTNPHGETFKDGSGLCRGMVAEFPTRPGFPDGWFLAGYWLGDNGETVYSLEVYSDREEAAREGDSMAEAVAEAEREHQEKWEAARDLEDKTEIAIERLRECLILRNHKCMAHIRREVSRLVETIRGNREKLASDFADVL